MSLSSLVNGLTRDKSRRSLLVQGLGSLLLKGAVVELVEPKEPLLSHVPYTKKQCISPGIRLSSDCYP